MTIRNTQQLIEHLNSGRQVKYVFFWGHQPSPKEVTKSCFSQWYQSPFTVDNNSYRTAEHFMMAEKARLFGDDNAAEKVLQAKTPGEAKKIGRQVQGFDEITWREKRFEIVVQANLNKFGQHQEMKNFLLSTGERVIVEASPLDKIWGVGLAADHQDCENPQRWQGLNLLGFALMEVRGLLRGNSAE